MKRWLSLSLLLAVLLAGCSSDTKSTETRVLEVDESCNERHLLYAYPGSVVRVRLRVYEDRSLRWRWVTSSRFEPLAAPEGFLEHPPGWIPGDVSYQTFWFRVDDRGGHLRFETVERRGGVTEVGRLHLRTVIATRREHRHPIQEKGF